MKKAIYILTVFLCFACGGSNIPNDVKYEITKEEINEVFKKVNLEVKLNKKINEQVLKEIALRLQKDRRNYQNIWIFYTVDGMPKGTTWATTHFSPELEVKILGSTEIQDRETVKTDEIVGEIHGIWRSEKSLSGAVLLLYTDTIGATKMRITFKDKSILENDVVKTKVSGKTKYADDNIHGEYYMIEPNGNLGLYGPEGKFDEAVIISNN